MHTQLARSLARLALPLVALLPAARAVSVNDVFIVKGGSTKGGCDGKNVDGWFADSQTLAGAAVTGAAATDTDNRQYLKTFFSIGPNDDPKQAGG
ncbi:hypothetical protein GGR56DRAFT_659205, partial [Xylariaceae sp. FL0804]